MCGCIDCGFNSTSLGRGKPELAPLAALSPLLTLQNHNAVSSWCLLPLATERLQPPFGQSWDGGNPGPSPPVALAGVCTDTCSCPHVHGRQCMESHFNQIHFDLERLCEQSNDAFSDGPLLWKCDNITCCCRHCVELHVLFCVTTCSRVQTSFDGTVGDHMSIVVRVQ